MTGTRDHKYEVRDGIPVLIAPDKSLFGSHDERGDFAAQPPRSRRRRELNRLLRPSLTYCGGANERVSRFCDVVLAEHGGGAVVLIIGGGTLGRGMRVLTDHPNVTVLETDVYLSDRVDLLCDAHALPFANGSLQGVVVQAVLEHVVEPARVVSEIHRVLAPRGVVFAETPFLQPVHEGAYDFTRWTESGHRRLFRDFIEHERGIVAGPASSLVWALCYFARSLAPDGTRLSKLLFTATRMAFAWFKYLDRWLITRRAAVDAACGVYFVGLRAADTADPVRDAHVIAGYRGTVGAITR